MRMQKGQLAGWGFHAGELAVQERAGVRVRHPAPADRRGCQTPSRIKDSVRRNPQADRSPRPLGRVALGLLDVPHMDQSRPSAGWVITAAQV